MTEDHSGWPPALKEFVNSTFAQCNDSNRTKVETELKKRVFEAFSERTLWTTDWASVQLDSLKPSSKRKKADIKLIPSAHLSAHASTSSTVAALGADEESMRQKRQRRFENESLGGPVSSSSPIVPMSVLRKGKGPANGMAGLSLEEQRSLSGTPDPVFNADVIEWDAQTIVGTSRQLEKPYLRLTSAPDPRTVRPLAVLRQTLEHLKRKWRSEGNYAWVCDQFKSLRQDLTVQRIKNDFTVMVYEIHARIALEKGDLGEYNQCQSQLRELYKHGLQGHPMEFLAYRILYLVHTRNRSDFNALLASLTPDQREDETVKHALDLRSAVATANYHQFFKLFADAPKMGPYMIDHFLDRERVNALLVMTKAYRTLPLAYVTNELAFDDPSAADAFLSKWRCAIYLPIDTTSTNGTIPTGPISIPLKKPVERNPAPIDGAAGQTSSQGAGDKGENEDKRQLDCKAAHPHFLAAQQTFAKVDIKGQI